MNQVGATPPPGRGRPRLLAIGSGTTARVTNSPYMAIRVILLTLDLYKDLTETKVAALNTSCDFTVALQGKVFRQKLFVLFCYLLQLVAICSSPRAELDSVYTQRTWRKNIFTWAHFESPPSPSHQPLSPCPRGEGSHQWYTAQKRPERVQIFLR